MWIAVACMMGLGVVTGVVICMMRLGVVPVVVTCMRVLHLHVMAFGMVRRCVMGLGVVIGVMSVVVVGVMVGTMSTMMSTMRHRSSDKCGLMMLMLFPLFLHHIHCRGRHNYFLHMMSRMVSRMRVMPRMMASMRMVLLHSVLDLWVGGVNLPPSSSSIAEKYQEKDDNELRDDEAGFDAGGPVPWTLFLGAWREVHFLGLDLACVDGLVVGWEEVGLGLGDLVVAVEERRKKEKEGKGGMKRGTYIGSGKDDG